MNIDSNSPYFSKVFLEFITRDVKFKNDMQAAFPEIYADIESFKTNPNCSCRSKIETFINSNRSRSLVFIEGWAAANTHVAINFDEIVQKYFVNNVAGKVYRIAKTDEAFAAFYKQTVDEKFVYRAFSVTVEADALAIYFL